MLGLIQRVSEASVIVNSKCIGQIKCGLVLFLCAQKGDDAISVSKMAKKVANIRVFEDEAAKMNLSLLDIKGELLVISQFTLAANTQKGMRPGFSDAAPPEIGKALYLQFISHYQNEYGVCQQGEFGANMQIALINDGPATFYLNT